MCQSLSIFAHGFCLVRFPKDIVGYELAFAISFEDLEM